MRTVAAILLGLSAAAYAAPVGDERLREGKEHAQSGHAAYNLGDWEKAVAEYKRSYELNPIPVLLYNIAQAYRQQGKSENALLEYKLFLAEAAPDAEQRSDAEDFIKELERLIEAERKSKQSPPTGPAKTPEPTTASPPAASPPTAAPLPPPPAAPPPESGLRRKVGIGFVAGGAVVAAAGLAMLAFSPFVYSNGNTATSRVDFNNLHELASTLRTVGALDTAVGAAALAAGVVLIVRGGDAARNASAWLAPTGTGFVAVGQF